MMQFDLFGDVVLNQEKKEVKKTVAEIKKDNAAALKKGAGSKAGNKYKYPVQIYFGPTTHTLEGEGEIEEDKLKDAVANILKVPASLVAMVKKYDKVETGSEVEAYVTNYAKNQPDSVEGWEIRHGEFTTLGSGKPADTVKAFAEQYPVFEGGSLVCDKKTKIAYVQPKADKGSDMVDLPFSYSWFGGETLVYNPIDADAVETDVDSDPDEEDEDGDGEADAQKSNQVPLAEVLTALKSQYKVNLIAKKDGDKYVIFPSQTGTSVANTPAKKKEEKFEVENVSLSLLLRHIPLSPEMFNGKKEIKADDLYTWLTPQHPEITKETSSFFWDKENRLIVCRLQGASKG